MKRILAIFGALVLGISLLACSNKTESTTPGSNNTTSNTTDPSGNTDMAAVESALNDLTVSSEVTADFTLITRGIGNTTITWTSDNAAIAVNGSQAVVTRPANEVGDATVKLVATAKKNVAEKAKEFTVIVKANDPIDKVEGLTIAEVYATSPDSGNVLKIKGIVSDFIWGVYNNEVSKQGFYLTDDTGTIFVYGANTSQKVEKGDFVVISGKYVLKFPDTAGGYAGNRQVETPDLIQVVTKGNAIPTAGAVTGKTIKEVADTPINAQNNLSSNTFVFSEATIKKVEGTGDSGKYVSYSIIDANGGSLGLYAAGSRTEALGWGEFAWLDQYLGKTVKLLFAVNGSNTGYTKWRGTVLSVIEVISDNPVGGGGGDTSEAVKVDVNGAILAKKDTKLEVKGNVIQTIVSGGNVTGFFINDSTGNIYVFGNKTNPNTITVGKYVTVTGTKDEYFGMPQVKLEAASDAVIDTTMGDNNTYLPTQVETKTIDEIANQANDGSLLARIVKVQGIYNATTKTISNGSSVINLYPSGKEATFAALDGKNVEMIAIVYDFHTTLKWRIVPMEMKEIALTGDALDVKTALDAVQNPFGNAYTEATQNVVLPVSTNDTVVFTFNSSSELVTIVDGKANIAMPASGKLNVTITLTATKNEASSTLTFKFEIGTPVQGLLEWAFDFGTATNNGYVADKVIELTAANADKVNAIFNFSQVTTAPTDVKHTGAFAVLNASKNPAGSFIEIDLNGKTLKSISFDHAIWSAADAGKLGANIFYIETYIDGVWTKLENVTGSVANAYTSYSKDVTTGGTKVRLVSSTTDKNQCRFCIDNLKIAIE